MRFTRDTIIPLMLLAIILVMLYCAIGAAMDHSQVYIHVK